MQKKKCKTNKTKDNIPDLKKKIKSLQDQVTRQDDMINAMAAQIAEIVRERKTEESERTKLIDSATGQADLGAICGTIRRIDNELNELKDQHSSCKNIGKTIDELGSLCAAAMVAAGTKLNPRRAGGGVWTPPPSGFSRIAKNGGAQRRRVFTHLTPHLFRNFCENFGPRPCEVRSPGQVKWPNYKITFPSRHGYNVSGKVMKRLEYDEVISAYKTYILDFWYRWPQVRSFLRPPHYKSMGKKSTLLYLLWRKRFWVEPYRIG